MTLGRRPLSLASTAAATSPAAAVSATIPKSRNISTNLRATTADWILKQNDRHGGCNDSFSFKSYRSSSNKSWLWSSSNFLRSRTCTNDHAALGILLLQQQQYQRYQHQQQQRRSYLYLPTSWKEFQLRLKARQEKQRLQVKLLRKQIRDQLQHTTGNNTNKRTNNINNNINNNSFINRNKVFLSDYSRTSIMKEQYGRAKNRSKLWVAEQRRRVNSKRSLLRVKRQAYQRRIKDRWQQVLKQQRGKLQNKYYKNNMFRTKLVTLTEYFEQDWFDKTTGRPLTSRDATGRFVNPWQSMSTSGVKTATSILMWRWERMLRAYRQYGLYAMVPNFLRLESLTYIWPSEWTKQWQQLFNNHKSSSSDKYTSRSLPTTTATTTTAPNNVPVIRKECLPPLQPRVPDEHLKLTWIGHATCLLQQGNLNILTDPIFSTRASPYETVIGVARDVPPAYTVDELPELIDLVLVTHDHYDHLDKQSVLDLKSRVCRWIVPLGIAEWLEQKCDIHPNQITELEWWESVEMERVGNNKDAVDSCDGVVSADRSISDNNAANQEQWREARRHALSKSPTDVHPALVALKSETGADNNNDTNSGEGVSANDSYWVTCTPVQHWASRTFWDRNYRLWCSFAVYTPADPKHHNRRHTVFFGGDTALPTTFPLFSMIRDYVGPIDLAALPIGAYLPDYMMQDAHMDPSQALRVHQILQAKKSIGIHWGTFCLSEEPMDEPPKLLQECIEQERRMMRDTTDREEGGNETVSSRSLAFVTIPIGDSLVVEHSGGSSPTTAT